MKNRKKEKRKRFDRFFFLYIRRYEENFIFFLSKSWWSRTYGFFLYCGKFLSKHDYNDLLQWILKSRITSVQFIKINFNFIF